MISVKNILDKYKTNIGDYLIISNNIEEFLKNINFDNIYEESIQIQERIKKLIDIIENIKFSKKISIFAFKDYLIKVLSKVIIPEKFELNIEITNDILIIEIRIQQYYIKIIKK